MNQLEKNDTSSPTFDKSSKRRWILLLDLFVSDAFTLFFSTLNLNTEAVGSQRCHPCNAITIEFSSSFSFFSADCPQDFQAGSYSSVVSRMINVSLPCSYLLGQLTTSTRRSKSKRDRDMMMTFGFLNENVSFHMLSGDSSAVFGPERIQQ